MGEEKKRQTPKAHRFTRRLAGAFSRACHRSSHHLDLTCYDELATRQAYRPTPLCFHPPPVPQQSPRLLICPIGTSSASRRFASGIFDARANARLAEREPESSIRNRSPVTLDPTDAQQRPAERQQQSGVGRFARRRRAATASTGNVARPTIDSPTGGATRFGLARLGDSHYGPGQNGVMQ
jgi:hypothetical protein